MAYLIMADRNGELDRRELRGDESLVIGRALDCDICIRDILLSRHHCQIERFDGNRWLVEDLASKNGTRVGAETITRHALCDGEVIRIGRSQICFREGPFVPAPDGEDHKRDVRPADPFEALAGTVCGFQFFDMEEDSRASGFPIPRPKPAEPRGYRQEGVHALVAEMASTSWDQILSEPDYTAPPSPAIAPRRRVHRLPSVPLHHMRSRRRQTIPTWLARMYILLACILATLCLAILVARSIA